MEEAVVLHYRTSRYHMGRSCRIPLSAPMRLTSWVEKSPDWCSPDELIVLQTGVQSMVTKNVKLIDVIQVMLVRLILPCQRRSRPLWEFNPKKHQTLRRLFDTSHEGAWKFLFKGNERPLATDSDHGHNCNRPPARYVTFDVLPN